MAISGELINCIKGHYYDPSKYDECPVCKREKGEEDSNTRGKEEHTVYSRMKYAEHSRAMTELDEENEETKSAVLKEFGFEPIAGWLVCIEGACKGSDYRIRCGRNFVGRDMSMDIVLRGDATVSRINHSIVSYDDKTNKYYYSPGMGRTIDHINTAPVFATVELKAGDVIEIGEMKLRFVPLCGSKFKWEDWNEKEDADITV